MIKCAKCKEEANEHGLRVSGGHSFYLCTFCNQFLDDRPMISLIDYLGPIYETQVSKNIIKAHRNRLEGKSPWK